MSVQTSEKVPQPQEGKLMRLVETDKYWGEISEEKMAELNEIISTKGLDAAREYARAIRREDFIFGKARSDFMHLLGLTPESVVLDCGAGMGIHTFNIAPLVKEVHSFDLSLARIQFCEHRAKAEKRDNVFLYHSDFAQLPFPDNFFDVIVMNGVVEWVGEIHTHENPRDDQLMILRMMLAKLKPGGRLYIGIENRIAPAYLKGYDHSGLRLTNFYPRWLANAVMRARRGRPYRTYTYTKRGYDRLLSDSGFDTALATYYVAHPGYNLPRYMIPYEDFGALSFFICSMSAAKGVLGSIARVIARTRPGLYLMRQTFYAYVIIARKKS